MRYDTRFDPLFDAIEEDGGRLAADIRIFRTSASDRESTVWVDTLHGWAHVVVHKAHSQVIPHALADILTPLSGEFADKPIVWHITPEASDSFDLHDFIAYFLITIHPGCSEIDAAGAYVCAMMSLGRQDLLPDGIVETMESVRREIEGE